MSRRVNYPNEVRKDQEEVFTTGSGDIFKDFGFSDIESAALAMKAYLFRTLQKALKERNEKQVELAKLLDVPQPKISDILSGKMSGFSVERITNYLMKLDYEIRLDAHPVVTGVVGRSRSKNNGLCIRLSH
jgi:predicted XRE-type DNA-binding protein